MTAATTGKVLVTGDAAVAVEREHLGEARFAAAWEAGRTLPVEQAVDEALAWAERA